VYGIGFALGSLVLLRTRATAGVAVFILGLLLSGTGGLLTGLAPVLGLAALAQAVAGSGNGLEVRWSPWGCSEVSDGVRWMPRAWP
jgi:hypothetical protein